MGADDAFERPAGAAAIIDVTGKRTASRRHKFAGRGDPALLLEDRACVNFGSAGLGPAKKGVDLFERAEEADEERRVAARGAAVAVEIRGAKLAVFGDDGAAHGAIFVGALGPRFDG